jgi:hypothetical protein
MTVRALTDCYQQEALQVLANAREDVEAHGAKCIIVFVSRCDNPKIFRSACANYEQIIGQMVIESVDIALHALGEKA